MKIEKITKDWLIKLEPLLSESFGEPITINDELEYFDEENPDNWFLSLDENNQIIGYIRSFPVSDNNHLEVELYAANNLATEKALIKILNENTEDKIIRFCLNKSQDELINYLKEIGYTYKIEKFRRYIYPNTFKSDENKSVRFANNNEKEIFEIKEVLEEFQDFSESKIIDLIEKNKLIVCEKHNKIVAVSLNNIFENYIEIVEITVKKEYRKSGFGEEILKGIFNIYPDKQIKLKVNSENIPAVKLYEKTGFKEILEETEIWLSKNYFV